MGRKRGWAAFNLEMPSEIPHTQYTMHAPWLEHLRLKHGKPNAGFEELLDFDFIWNVDGPAMPKPGRCTDMGHAVFAADGSDYRQPAKSPFDDDLEAIYTLDPFAEYGRLDVKKKAAEYQAWWKTQEKADYVIPHGTYNSVVSFAIWAFGWENLLVAAGADEERFGRLLNRWADYLMQWVEAQAMTDIPIFHTHDDMVWTAGGIFSPEFYRKYVFPNYKRYWDCSRNAGKKVLFTSDGCFSQYIDDIAAAGAGGFIFEPTTDLAYICQRYGRTHVIIGNADCRVLTFGTKDEVRQEVKRCMDLGRNCPGYFFAVGNHIPPNVPIENADACIEAYMEMRRR